MAVCCLHAFGTVSIYDLKQNWRTYNEGAYKAGQIYIGTFGRGIWTTGEYLSIPDAQDNIQVTATISDLLLYPNPVVNNATVSFSVKEEGLATLRVYSLMGKVVQEVQGIQLNVGNNKVGIAAEKLALGTYIVKISTDNYSKTTKFIKQ